MPDGAFLNSWKVLVRFCCFCLPYIPNSDPKTRMEAKFTHVQIQDRDVNVVQQLAVVLDRVTAGEKYDDLLLEVLAEEGEEKEESSI
jgi:hypothetical protein